VLVLEWKRWSRLRGLRLGFLGIVTGSVPGASPYQTLEHEGTSTSTIWLRLGRAVLIFGYPFRFYAYSPETLASSIFDNGSV
jgi:hypothetical protein